MTRFTDEQIAELETIFGIKRAPTETLRVRDGVVNKETMVWWRGEQALKHVLAGDDWYNIKEFPDVYQLEKPLVLKVVYDK